MIDMFQILIGILATYHEPLNTSYRFPGFKSLQVSQQRSSFMKALNLCALFQILIGILATALPHFQQKAYYRVSNPYRYPSNIVNLFAIYSLTCSFKSLQVSQQLPFCLKNFLQSYIVSNPYRYPSNAPRKPGRLRKESVSNPYRYPSNPRKQRG